MKEKFKHLRFGQVTMLSNGYDQIEKFTEHNCKDAIVCINETIDAAIEHISSPANSRHSELSAENRYSVVMFSKLHFFKNLFLKKSIKENSFLMLDCDSQQNASLVQEGLRQERIDYFRVQSSPGHYWFLCAKIGSVAELCEIMDRIPGVDPKYKTLTRQTGRFVLRAFPKEGVTPSVNVMSVLEHRQIMSPNLDGTLASHDHILCVLNNENGLSDFLYLLAWVKEFTRYWQWFDAANTAHHIVAKQLQYARMLADFSEQQERILVSDSPSLLQHPTPLYHYSSPEENDRVSPISNIDLSQEKEVVQESENQFDPIGNIKL